MMVHRHDTRHRHRQRRPRKPWKLTGEAVVFTLGCIGFLHELFLSTTERPSLLFLCAGAMGLPAFWHLDERRRG